MIDAIDLQRLQSLADRIPDENLRRQFRAEFARMQHPGIAPARNQPLLDRIMIPNARRQA
jgi:hypothetical protein